MKKIEKKSKVVIFECLTLFTLVNIVSLLYFKNIELAITIQLVLYYVFDFFFRRHLFSKKRKVTWNITCGILKALALLLSLEIHLVLGIVVTLFTIVSTRIMFFEDNDRTVQTVDELKQASFIPVIAKTFRTLKHRAIYVLTE